MTPCTYHKREDTFFRKSPSFRKSTPVIWGAQGQKGRAALSLTKKGRLEDTCARGFIVNACCPPSETKDAVLCMVLWKYLLTLTFTKCIPRRSNRWMFIFCNSWKTYKYCVRRICKFST
ncbi:hypothetical protein CEXT_332481 [Caerostris extrusa]|uniref:Uncharacterized protein n=1 Tax=Caerostris extrusa TaxID=172846 RepID=A0AAV4QXZ9_CAEEX|nr:hypothetical protein CEXT_332481 [Caerostris extrusa]